MINSSLINKNSSSQATVVQQATYTALQANLATMIQLCFAYGNTTLLKATYQGYINNYYFEKADGYFDKIEEIQTQQDAYKLNWDEYYSKHQRLFDRYNFEFAIYDEIE